jgi:putative restriction endonuclease
MTLSPRPINASTLRRMMSARWPHHRLSSARIAWPHVVAVALRKGTITYKALSIRLGYTHHRPVRWPLGVIQDYCKLAGVPPLQAVVVNARTGVPGLGYVGSSRRRQAYRHALGNVHSHGWLRPPPF